MTISEDFYIYSLTQDGNQRRLASPLPAEFAREHGLCSQALAGEFINGDTPGDCVENFRANPEFVRFLQWCLAKHAPAAPGFIAEAQKKPEGPMFIVDIRALHQGQEPQEEDLIGLIVLDNGQPTEFKGSPNYQVLTKHGFLRIDPWLREKYLQELQEHALSKKNDNQPG